MWVVRVRMILGLLLAAGLLAACGAPIPTASPTPAGPASTAAATLRPAPSATAAPQPLSDEAATLASLEQVDDHPLYAMRYKGAYTVRVSARDVPARGTTSEAAAWACSLFAALADESGGLFGRNFDWDWSPALLLFTAPPGGYASVSMVDVHYLGFSEQEARNLLDLSPEKQRRLLGAPLIPFDGMNDQGLVVGMAAVPPGGAAPDPARPTVGSLGVIRLMLDRAANVDEAVAILGRYNVDMEGGPPLHYLIGDRTGRAVLVEFYQGKMVAIPNDRPWHLATNFIRASRGTSAEGECARYDRLSAALSAAAGRLDVGEAMDLLAQVAQESTQLSVVYSLTTGDVNVVMGRDYAVRHTFRLD